MKARPGRSLPKGVSLMYRDIARAGKKQRYVARIRVKGVDVQVGCFSTPDEAHAAYVAAAETHFGEFARAA